MQKRRLPISSACYAIVSRQRGRAERKDRQVLAELRFYDSREQRDQVACRKNGFVDLQGSGLNTNGRAMRRAGKKTLECLPARRSASGQNLTVAGQSLRRDLANAGERVLTADENGVRVREQKFFPDVGRPGGASEHPEQQVEIAGTQGIEQRLVGAVDDVNRCARI